MRDNRSTLGKSAKLLDGLGGAKALGFLIPQTRFLHVHVDPQYPKLGKYDRIVGRRQRQGCRCILGLGRTLEDQSGSDDVPRSYEPLPLLNEQVDFVGLQYSNSTVCAGRGVLHISRLCLRRGMALGDDRCW